MIFQTFFLILVVGASCQSKIRHLACNSVNQLGQDEEINFIFIGAKSADCTFLFEGPQNTRLDMKVHSLSDGNYISGSPCLSQNRLKVYDYRVDAFVNMANGACLEQDDGSVTTDTNMGVVRSLVGNGSFFVRIKTIPAIRTKGIEGMNPPFEDSQDFFRAEELTHEAESFMPSLGVPGYKPLSTSYGVPAAQSKPGEFPYPGKPGQIIDFTTSKPTTSKNETLTSQTGSTTTTITISSRPITDSTTTRTTTRNFNEE